MIRYVSPYGVVCYHTSHGEWKMVVACKRDTVTRLVLHHRLHLTDYYILNMSSNRTCSMSYFLRNSHLPCHGLPDHQLLYADLADNRSCFIGGRSMDIVLIVMFD